MSGSEGEETQLNLNREAVSEEAYQVILELFGKYCPDELDQVNSEILAFRIYGSRRRERLGEPNPTTIKGIERYLYVEVTGRVASEMDIATDLSLSISTVLTRAPGINKATTYCFINMYAPYTPRANDPEVMHQVVIRGSNVANEPKQIFVIGEGDGFYSIDDEVSLHELSNVAGPADQEDLGWIKGLIDAIRDADEKGRIEVEDPNS